MVPYRRLLFVLLFLIVLWAVFRYSGLASHINAQFLQERFAQHKLVGLIIFTGLFAVGNLVHIPGWLFLVSAMVALGQAWGGLATYLAACVTCATTFGVVQLVGGQALRNMNGRISSQVFARLDARPVWNVFVLRLLFQTMPTMNYALALSGVRFSQYMLGTILGLPVPITLFSVFFGTLAQWFHWPIPQGM